MNVSTVSPASYHRIILIVNAEALSAFDHKIFISHNNFFVVYQGKCIMFDNFNGIIVRRKF